MGGFKHDFKSLPHIILFLFSSSLISLYKMKFYFFIGQSVKMLKFRAFHRLVYFIMLLLI